MHAVRLLVAVGVVSMLAGCAGKGSRTSLARLQSQFNLLDERVTQLERSGFTGAASAPSAEGWTSVAEPARPAASASPAVKVGSGAAVKPSTREIQQALKNAGFYQGAVDGKMGPMTRQAITEFQRINGLNPDGVVGRQTWAKLRAYADLSSGGEVSAAEPLK